MMRRLGCAVALVALIAAAEVPVRQVAATSAAITAADLRTRLEIFSHDSLQGRALASAGLLSATQYIARELQRLGLEPRGDGGSYLSQVPLELVELDIANARLGFLSGGRPFSRAVQPSFKPGVDFIPITRLQRRGVRSMHSATVHYGGRFGGRQPPPADSLLPFLGMIFLPAIGDDGVPNYAFWESTEWLQRYRGVDGIVVGGLELAPRRVREWLLRPRYELAIPPAASPAVMRALRRDSMPPVFAATTSALQLFMRYTDSSNFVRSYETRVSTPRVRSHNVVAFLRGRDPILRSEVVVLSATADGSGLAAVEDRIDGDSIINGANVGGSGAMALLEIAEYLVAQPERPRRSVMFLWTVGSQDDDVGADWFLANQGMAELGAFAGGIELGAIGRRAISDSVGDPAVAMIGAGDVSSTLAAWFNELRGRPASGVRPDSAFESGATADRLRCAGTQGRFTRRNLPSAMITTGFYGDHHSVRDDASRIDYESYERLAKFAASAVLDLADGPRRPQPDTSRAADRGCG